MNLQDFRIHKRLNLNPSVIEEIYTKISEIEGVKNSWYITGQILSQTLDRLTRSVIITSTGSSNRIEGNKLTDEQEIVGYYKHMRQVKERFINSRAVKVDFFVVLYLSFKQKFDQANSKFLKKFFRVFPINCVNFFKVLDSSFKFN